ncbi:MAG: glutamate-5-semialdehyde dehydrogenase, partial [Clostridiales bacterium]|nr:glutamate-5-semialdehyde dehydrogenase [Clostridiales bacterium]
AKKAAAALSVASSNEKDSALKFAAQMILENADEILAANKKDIDEAVINGMNPSMIDRLTLNQNRLQGIADGILEVVAQKDPIGEVISGTVRPNGLRVHKVRVPLGVLGIIYESRPNVTADAAALCIKSGNAVILRGGKEAINSNKAIAATLRCALEKAGLPADCVQLVEDTSRESAHALMHLNGYLDALIPRGGKGLIRSVKETATVPVIETGAGNCHIFIDESANAKMAAEIVFNSKTSRPSVCNAAESLVIHKNAASRILPVIKERLDEKDVLLKCDEYSFEILKNTKNVATATDADFAEEFLDFVISVKTVENLDEAVEHISKYSTGHTECIVTENYQNANEFTRRIDSAAVVVNASTRFTDGGQFGLGCEIGISTQKLHARGPMGVNELTSCKFIVYGNGQVR